MDRVNEGSRSLVRLCWVSAVYDAALGLPLLVAASEVARLFGAPAPQPEINAQLNGVFTLSLAAGYGWAARDVAARRGYLWIFGVFAKLLGALLFVGDHLFRGSPAAFLVFAGTDGVLGLVTLGLLLATGRSGARA